MGSKKSQTMHYLVLENIHYHYTLTQWHKDLVDHQALQDQADFPRIRVDHNHQHCK